MMKTKFLLILLALTSITAQASIKGAPFIPEEDARFNCLESGVCSGPGGPYVGVSSGYGYNGKAPMTVWKDDVTISGKAAGTYSTNIVIPANSIIRQAYVYVKQAVLPATTATQAIQCNVANDILSAADKSGAAENTIFAGVPIGTAGTMISASVGCTVALKTTGSTATAGEWEILVETVPSN